MILSMALCAGKVAVLKPAIEMSLCSKLKEFYINVHVGYSYNTG